MKTMNMTNRTLSHVLISVMLLILVLPAFADDVNNSAAAYMRMGVGARIVAMGEAGAAISRDITSGYWNPAGLTMMKDIEVGTMYNFGLDHDRNHKYASFGKRFDFGALALSWVNTGVSDIDGYDDTGNPTGSFSDDEHNIALSYANYYKRLSYGLTPKFYLSSMDGESETGFGLDLGAKYDLNQYLELGLMARDLYGSYAGDRVPLELALGAAAYPLIGVTLAADLKWEQDETPYPCFGAEYWTSIGKDPEADSKLSVVSVREKSTWGDAFSYAQTGIRLGFNQGRFSAGTGIRFRNFQLDYVFRLNNHDIFGDDHIISMILRF